LDVVIVCHVEFGYATDRSVIYDTKRTEGSIDGVRNAISLSEGLGAVISFMIKPEVLQVFAGFDFMHHEIGLHVHPDDLLLVKEGLGGANPSLREFDLDQQRNMISTGRRLVSNTLGISPRTFVAGKWSVSNATVRALLDLGFTHDASALPGFSSSSCDWRKLPRVTLPYRPSREDYQLEGDMEITMVPVSKEIANGMISPENNVGVSFLQAALLELAELGVPFVQIAFHSPAMLSKRYRKAFAKLLQCASDLGASFRPLSEVRPVRAQIAPNSRRYMPYLRNIDASALSFLLPHAIRNPRSAVEWFSRV
jgi:hypothetical protein